MSGFLLQLKPRKSHYPTVRGRDVGRVGIVSGALCYELVRVPYPESREIEDRQRRKYGDLLAMPTYCSYDPVSDQLAVWPCPDAAYDLVRL